MDKRIADGNDPRLHTDLYIYQCGSLPCESGHAYGPTVRDHFLIHYVHSGKGIFQVGNTTWHLKAGNGFLICPDVVTFYQADRDDPWHYSWIGFHGLKAEHYLKDAGLSAEHPIFEYTEDDFIDNCFQEMATAYYLKKGGMVKRLAYLYLFLHKLTQLNTQEVYYDSSDRKELYVTLALQYIELNYSRKITVKMISDSIGLNRSYLNSVFKSSLGKTLQEYLMEFRVRKACELLANESLTIRNISLSVGYTDPLLFSKVFKSIQGVTPSEYKRMTASLKSLHTEAEE